MYQCINFYNVPILKNYIVVIVLLSYLTCFAQEEPEDEVFQRYDLQELTIEGKAKLKRGDKVVLNNLNFKGGTTTLLSESEPVLKELLKIMQENPNLKIQVQGHICCQNDEQHEISGARARFVWRYLKKNGIAKERMSHKDFGGTAPLYAIPETSDCERGENRRVEIEIIES